MAAQDPYHSGELYPIFIIVPAQHDYYMLCRGLDVELPSYGPG